MSCLSRSGILLASVLLALPLQLACSSSNSGGVLPAADAGKADARKDAGASVDTGVDVPKEAGQPAPDTGAAPDGGTTVREASTPPDTGVPPASGDCPVNPLPAEDTATVSGVQKAGMAPTVVGACTKTDLDAFVAKYIDPNTDWNDVATSVSGNCKACLVGTSEAGPYKPFSILSADEGYDDSASSCMAKRSGEPTCGSSVVAWETCAGLACVCGEASDSEYDACIAAQWDNAPGPCSGSRTSYRSACKIGSDADEKVLVDTCYISASNPTEAQQKQFFTAVLDYLCGTGAEPAQP